MIVVIAGIYRSGSTAQYNMVRLVLEAIYGENINCIAHPKDLKSGINVVKMHPFDQKLYDRADFIFTTDRPDAEIRRSFIAFSNGKNQCDDKFLCKIRRDLSLWRRGSFHQEFTDIRDNPKKCIGEIINVFKVELDAETIYRKFQEVKVPSQQDYYDKKTFLFYKHISKYDNSKI